MEYYIAFVIVILTAIGIYMYAKKSKNQKKQKLATYEQFLNEEGFIVSKTQKVGNRTLYVDDVHKQWTVVKGFVLVQDPEVYTYSDLIGFEILEDGESIAKGRVIGSKKNICTNLQVRIRVNNFESPEIIIPLIYKEVLKDSFYYKTQISIAEELIADLMYIKNNDNHEEQSYAENV